MNNPRKHDTDMPAEIDFSQGVRGLHHIPPGSIREPICHYHTDRDTTMQIGTERITIEPGKRGGKPCIRGLRITVWDVLGWLGAGMTEAEILDDHPDLEKEDFPAVYQFAAETGRRIKTG